MKSKTPHKKTKRRVGRGPGSTKGKTCGRGMKGQKARSGSKARLYSEGGQNTIIRRLPKRGFNRPQKKPFDIINITTLTNLNKSEIKPEDLIQAGLIKRIKEGIKILANGSIDKPVTVHAHAFSNSAKEKIEKAGGQAVLIQASQSA